MTPGAGPRRRRVPPPGGPGRAAVLAALLLSASGLGAQEDTLPPPRSWSLLPYAYYTPESGVAVGLLGAMVQETPGSARVQRSFRTSGEYTFKGHRTIWARYEAQPDARWLWMGEASGVLAVTNRFYPAGNRAGREDYEEWTRRGVDARAQILRRVGHPSLFLGVSLELSRVLLRELDEGGLLAGGGVPGAEDHSLLGLGAVAVVDSRDSQIFPRDGCFHSLTLTGYRGVGGFDENAGRLEVDLRRYLQLGGGAVLAVRGRLASSWGTVPFTLNTSIGGTGGGLRGLYGTRYADRSAALALAELRFPLAWRLGGVVFGGAGQVAPELSGLGLRGVHGAAGGGLRFAFMPESGLNLGVDFAMGEGESGLYFLLGEVF